MHAVSWVLRTHTGKGLPRVTVRTVDAVLGVKREAQSASAGIDLKILWLVQASHGGHVGCNLAVILAGNLLVTPRCTYDGAYKLQKTQNFLFQTRDMWNSCQRLSQRGTNTNMRVQAGNYAAANGRRIFETFFPCVCHRIRFVWEDGHFTAFQVINK